MSDPLFGAMFSTPAADEALDGPAWLRAMLDVEAALARAAEAVGLIPPGAGAAITACCVGDRFDLAGIGRRAAGAASPVVPLVADLRAVVGDDLAAYVHLGATSQDVIDTAMGLLARRALAPVGTDLAGCADRLGVLADTHRHTAQLGRTLLQPATATTFGVVCAGWLVGLDEARRHLDAAARRLAVQLGGPVGTTAGWAGSAGRLTAALAGELGLATPTLPWHTTRNRIAELAAALGVTGGALGTVALDVTLLAQGEVAELAEGTPGGSSALPHKRNPAAAVQVTAAVHRMPGLVASVLAGMPQELQRAAGRWQAEWATVTDLLRLLAAAAAHTRALLTGLRVDADRMRTNLAAAADDLSPAADDLSPAADDLSPAADDLARAADDLARAADDLVERALAAHADTTCSATT